MATPSPQPDDTALVKRLRNGDESVLEELLRDSGAKILRALTRRYRSAIAQADLEDVLAIALFRVWRGRHLKADQGSLQAWFHRIADNVARDILRHGWHKARRLEVTVDPGILESSRSPSPPSGAETNKWTAVVREIVETLPDLQRKIVWADVLSREGPVPSEQLAKELGLSSSTVRVYRKRALDKIRDELSRRGFPLEESRMCHGHLS